MRRLVLVAAATLSACSLDQDLPTGLAPSAVSYVETKDMPVSTARRVDLLFVIDDSAAIAPYQATLRENLPRFAAVLETIQGGIPSLHVGFVAGDDPILHGGSGVTGAYIESRPQYAGPPLTDFSSLPAAFSSLGDLGSAGSPEQPLLATAIRALTAAGNGDFRRPNAELCVVFIAPADDHSLASVDTLAAQLAVLPAVVHPVVAGIYSPGAPRMTAFLNAFPNRSTAVDIHLQDLSDGLILLGGWIGSHLASPCIDATLVDLDPGAPGLQPSCSVSDVQRPAGTEQALPACDATGSIRPCWRIAVDAQSCPPDPQLALEVLRADFPPDDTSVVAQCEALVPPND